MRKLPYFLIFFSIILFLQCSGDKTNRENNRKSYLQISGIYPHLTAYNQPKDSIGKIRHRESGIGVVMPWAGKLWYLTYPPHMRTGSNDKLYMVDEEMNLTIRKESIGGTHANRMIHKESNQLFMGPYAIDAEGNVRGADVQKLEGRLTATTRHLTDPENKILYYDMEGKVYEMNVHTLEVNELFEKPVPGWHGKGAYVGQGRLIVANNGEHQGHSMAYSKLLVGGEAESWDEAGVLAEWNGEKWRIVERKQFTDVMGPGGLSGNESENDPVWSMGWDKRSVILKLLDGGEWFTYRLPKASHTYDPRHGWFTEWPRIREFAPKKMMMTMHGSMFHFPKTFSRTNTVGITPMTTHLRYIPDFGHWNGRVILAADDASTLQNPIVGQPQSNLWFGTEEDLKSFGPKVGWGGVWMNDKVKAGETSDPYLIDGYDKRILHLVNHSEKPASFDLEIDYEGKGEWEKYKTVEIPASKYHYEFIGKEVLGKWLRIISQKAGKATAYLHYYSPRKNLSNESNIFSELADVGNDFIGGLIRPSGHNKSLQMLLPDDTYLEVSLNDKANDLTFSNPSKSRSEEVKKLAALAENPFTVDEASIILQNHDGTRYRLPKGAEVYENMWKFGRSRALREVQSERFLANIHGMFYEVPRAEGAGNHVPDYQKIKPVSRHDKMIADYCSWRGLLVLAGAKPHAAEDGQIFNNGKGIGLWFGAVDDLWKFDKPTGIGGPWKNTAIKADQFSDPYIMTGFDQKTVKFSHNLNGKVNMTLEVAINHQEWQVFETFEVSSEEELIYRFPEGYQAHWVRVKADKDCVASAIFVYE